jgi:hypothetical protein
MKRKMLLAVLAVFALGAATLANRVPTSAQETPPLPDMFLIGPSQCLALTQPTTDAVGACPLFGKDLGLLRTDWVNKVLDKDHDGKVTREEVASLDLDKNQLHQNDGVMAVILFVKDDHPIRFNTTKGVFAVGVNTSSSFTCSLPGGGLELDADEDCDDDDVAGDGILFAQLQGNGGDVGAAQVTAIDDTNLKELARTEFDVVAEPKEIKLDALESTVEEGLDADNPDDCTLPTDVAGFTAALADPHKAVIIARVSNSDGINIASAWVHWVVDDPDKADVPLPDTPTLDLGGFGVGAPQVVCGFKGSGTVKLTALIMAGPNNNAISMDPGGFTGGEPRDKTTLDVTVGGEPATINLTANPATLACDGTASSTISATVIDAAGNNVVNGVSVNFDVQVLGTANPIKASTANGVATSVVTPLAIQDTGVPVIVTAGNVQSSILVQCAAAAPPPAPPSPAPGGAPGGTGTTPSGTISGPNTGSGGYPTQHQGATFPWWAFAALAAAGLASLGGSRVLERIRRG